MGTIADTEREEHLSKQGRFLRVVAGIVLFMLAGRVLGYRFGPNTIVRCRQGHLFTTIWIPGVKLKAIDLVVARVQRCPVGHHWTLVTPVRESSLGVLERRRARARHDIRLP